MSEAAKSKRRWFQFHLLTLLMTVIAAAALLSFESAFYIGIPKWWTALSVSYEKADAFTAKEVLYFLFCPMVNLAAVVGLAVICEIALRRREARKP